MTSRKLEIKYVPIDAVKPWDKNPKKHNKKAILESIKRFKPTQPILVQKGTGLIIAGHGRLEAFKELGYEEIPIIELEMNDAEARAYALVDNQTVIAGGWDEDLLKINIQDLKLELPDLDMSIFGFSDKQTGKKGEEDDFDVDAALDDDVEPITKPGDLIILGEHRLLCGDSTKKEDVERLMGGVKADICFTSPPYNAGSLNIKGHAATGAKYLEISDDLNEDEYVGFLNSTISNALIAADDAMINIGLVEGNKRAIIRILNLYIDNFKDIIYWKKSTCAPHIQPGVINNQIEFILCFGDGKRRFKSAQFRQGTYWNVIEGPPASNNEYAKIHKATFPVYLPANIIENFCPPEGRVFEPFLGTGTTLIACEQLGRTCYGMEIDPKYCDVIVQRWESFTNKKAVRT